jgi:hypothetical protein
MHFSYDGFTHEGSRRYFLFHGIEEQRATGIFCIEIDLPLFSQSRIPFQDGPLFCLELLNRASLGGQSNLDRYHMYRVVAEDFRPILVERERVAAEKALRVNLRRPVRRPSHSSNLYLGSRAHVPQ